MTNMDTNSDIMFEYTKLNLPVGIICMRWELIQSLVGEINLLLLINNTDKWKWCCDRGGFRACTYVCSRVSPQRQPLLHLPEKTCVEPVQRLKGGEDGVLQRLWSGLVLPNSVLERLQSESKTQFNFNFFFLIKDGLPASDCMCVMAQSDSRAFRATQFD